MSDSRKAQSHKATGRVRDLRKIRIGSVAEALGGIEPGVDESGSGRERDGMETGHVDAPPASTRTSPPTSCTAR